MEVHRQLILGALLAACVAGCADGGGGGSSPPATAPGAATPAAIPAAPAAVVPAATSTTDPAAGTTPDPAAPESPALTPAPEALPTPGAAGPVLAVPAESWPLFYEDLQVPTNAAPFPVLDPAFDALNAPLPAFEPHRLRTDIPLPPERIGVVRSGTAWLAPPCPFPIAPRALITDLSPTLDGDPSEWAGKPYILLDGQGESKRPPHLDFRSLRLAQTADAYFALVQLGGPWAPDAAEKIRLDLELRFSGTIYKIGLRGTRIGLVDGTTFTPLSATDATYLATGNYLEIRIATSAIPASGAFSRVALSVRNIAPGSPVADERAFTPNDPDIEDYICRVAFPKGREKLLYMQRSKVIAPQAAEIAYRLAQVASPEVESILDDEYTPDSFEVNARESIDGGIAAWNSGGYMSFGVGLKDTYPRGFNDDLGTACHEMGHAFNGNVWGVPGRLVEGNSEWVRAKCMGSLVNRWKGMTVVNGLVNSWAKNFDQNGVVIPVDVSPTEGHGGGIYYTKGAVVWILLEAAFGYDAMHGVLKRRINDLSRFLEALTQLPTFKGVVSPTMWDGWITAGSTSFDGSFLTARPDLDGDGDGLKDFFELGLGTDPAKFDTDGDGISDFGEYAFEMDPLVPAAAPELRLVADHSLAEWETVAPGSLGTSFEREALPACAAMHAIKRYGALYDGRHLVVGAEFAGSLGETDSRQVRVQITLPTGVVYTVRAKFRDAEPDTSTKGMVNPNFSTGMLAPPLADAIEISQHIYRLGLPAGLPQGTTVKIFSDKGIKGQGYKEGCHETPAFTVMLLPAALKQP